METLPGIISQLTSDLAESIDCPWAIVVTRVGSNLLPLYTFGAPPQFDRCLAHLNRVLEGEVFGPLECAADWAPEIICPVQLEGEDLAILAFGPREGGEPYSSNDRDFVTGLAAHVSALLSNDRLAATVARTICRVRQTKAELESAREIQRRFLPGRLRPVRGLDYYGEREEASEMGSDFFDFVAQGPSSLLLSIGDVSAKGIPAAMIMAGLQASLRAFGLTNRNRISSMVRDLNRMVCQLSPDHLYATMFYARIDTLRRELQYVNAGHQPPLLVRDRDSVALELENTGTVLGLCTRTAYRQRAVALEPGDILVALSEDCDAPKQVVLDAVRSDRHASSSTLARNIMHAIGVSGPDCEKAVVVVRFLGAAALEVVPTAPLRNHALARMALAG